VSSWPKKREPRTSKKTLLKAAQLRKKKESDFVASVWPTAEVLWVQGYSPSVSGEKKKLWVAQLRKFFLFSFGLLQP
jgi:hypothetical protein